jgi:peptidoglycan-associated lipoprotein
MQPRFAALLFSLGLCDLGLVNLGLAPEVFADRVEPQPPSAVEPSPPQRGTREPPAPEAPSAHLTDVAHVTPPAEAASGVTQNEAPAPNADHTTPPPSPGELGPAPSPGDSAGPASAGALPGSPSLPRTPVEAASEPAARDAVEAARDADAEVLTADLTVGFPDTASAVLTQAAREELLTLAAHMLAHPNFRLRLIGHADARGTREFNKYLGSRRARAVSALLTAAGVPLEQLEIESRGEDQPRVVGTSDGVLAANRRVEIRIASERSETP